MAVKRANQKKIYKEWLMKYAVKIKCCYCNDRNICKYREHKEKDEKVAITYCTLTPNRPKNSPGIPPRVKKF